MTRKSIRVENFDTEDLPYGRTLDNEVISVVILN